jgi:hypothetical protein
MPASETQIALGDRIASSTALTRGRVMERMMSRPVTNPKHMMTPQATAITT